MFPGPTELPQIGYSIESIWIQNPNQVHQHQETNLPTCLPREISHVMNGIIFSHLFNLSHFSSAECSEGMSKRTQEESDEERVTAKSMMSLIAQAPSALLSSASESLGKKSYECQSPLECES